MPNWLGKGAYATWAAASSRLTLLALQSLKHSN
jgi:hypothetical protein